MTSHRPTPTGHAAPETRRIRWPLVSFGLALGICAVALGPSATLAQTAEPRQDQVGTKVTIFDGFLEDLAERPTEVAAQDVAGKPPALREDDIERAIWFIEDLASSFGQLAAGDKNKHAKAAWLILEENYRAATQTLERLRRDRRIQLADLDAGQEATLRESVVLVDGTLDGAWPSERLAGMRQIGGDDWQLISHLSSILLQQLVTFRTLDDWTWFKRHLRQSGSLQDPAETLDPALATELIRFAHIEDKYLLARTRMESAPSSRTEAVWRARAEAVASEAEAFVLRHAAAFSPSSAARFARAWREYAQSAQQAATAYAGVTFKAPPAAEQGGTAASRASSTPTRTDTRWPALTGLIDAVPERIKRHTTLAAAPSRSASEAPAAEARPTEASAAAGSGPSNSAGTETVPADPVVAGTTASELAIAEPAPAAAKPENSAEPAGSPSASAETTPAEPAASEPASAAAPPASTLPTGDTPAVQESTAPEIEPVPVGDTAAAADSEPAAASVAEPAAVAPEQETLQPGMSGAGTAAPDSAAQVTLSMLAERAAEEEQAQQWREALNRETFQANGVTVPIRDEITPRAAAPLSTIESSVEPAAGGEPAAVMAEPAADLDGGSAIRLQPLQPESESVRGAGQVRPGLEWLQDLAERHRELIALLPVAVLLALIVLVAAWLWRSSRGRSEEPLILTTELGEDPYAAVGPAAAATARQGPAQAQWSAHWDASGRYADQQHAAAERATARSATPRSAAAGGMAQRAEPVDADAFDSEAVTQPQRRDAAAHPGRDGPNAVDPYARARSELERSRPGAKVAGTKVSSAIAVVQAAAKHYGEAQASTAAEMSEEPYAAQPGSSKSKPSGDAERTSGPQELITALRSGDAHHFETLFEQQTGLTRRDVRDLLRKAKPDELAIACRGIGVDQLAFASMVIMIRRRYLGEAEVPPHQLSSALAAFISTSPEEARSRLESWGLDAEFTPLDGPSDQGSAAGYSY